jgi:4-hydroxybenzoate polyprenyltransferase
MLQGMFDLKQPLKNWYTHFTLAYGRSILNKTLKGFLKLTRFNEYVYFVIITTLLGIISAEGTFDWRLVVALLANWTAVGFAFMINDIEDAPDDALSNEKVNRNPVSAGLITPKAANGFTYSVAVLSAALFALLGLWPFILGVITLILGFLYSHRLVRLKTIAFFDIVSHCLMLAGLQFLSGYFAYTNTFNEKWFWPFTFVVTISIYGELYNEIRDLEGDQAAQLRHTAIVLGDKISHILMLTVLAIGIFSGVITFFVIDLIPSWVLIVMAVLAGIFLLPPLLKIRKGDSSIAIQSAFQKPLERAAAIAFLLQFLLPWIDHFIDLGFI